MAEKAGVPPASPRASTSPRDELHAEQERIRATCQQQRQRAADMRKIATELRAQSQQLLRGWS
jgi:hypothetical protein